MRHSPTNERGWIVAVKVLDVEKRKAKEHSASKNYYEFLLKVKWSDENQYCIFRRYSMFFDLQAGLRQLFQQKQNIVIPDLPVARLAQAGGMLFGAMVKKQCKNIDEFCQKVIQLPPVVSQSDIVLQFFSQWGTDAVLSKPISPPSPPTGTGKDEEQIVERYRSVAIFNASGRGEMSLRENEPVTVIEKNHTGWWLVANLKGEHGFAPATFLEPVEGTRHAGEEEWREVEDDDRMWVAVESYTAQCEDELSYNVGDDVEVLATSNLGWWKIRIRGSVGLTPGSNLAPKPKNDVADTYAAERRGRRSSYSSVSGIYASIRSPPPRRESSLGRAEESRKKLLISRSVSTPHALEYATVEIVPSPTQKSPQYDFDDSNNVPEYATVIPKHLRAKPRSRSMSETGGELKRSLKAKQKGSPELPRSPPTAHSRRFMSVDNDDNDFSDSGYATARDVRPASVNYRMRAQGFADGDITRLTSRKYVNVASSNHINNTIGQHFVAITHFSPPSDRPEDLPLAAGETVRLLSEDGVWAFVCTVDPSRRRGWVPSSLLKVKGSLQEPTSNRRSLSLGDITDAIQLEEAAARKNRQTKPPVPSPRSDLEIRKAPKNHPPPPEGEAPPLPGVPSNHKAQAKINASYFVIEDFTTSDPNCISVRAGEVGQLLEATPSGWWKMNVDGVIGWTPRDFWSLREDSSSSFGDELWFYGKLSRQKCEEIMMKNSRELDYLVRESAQKFASFVLSVKYGGKIRHFPIEVTRSGRYVIGKHAFDGLTEIVCFYKTNALFYTSAKEPVSLGQPFRGS